MWTTEHSLVTTVSKEAIWKVWADVENWPTWDKEVEWCKLNGKFEAGTRYTLKPVGGPEVKAIIEKCQRLVEFVDISSLPLAKMTFAHEMADVAGGVKVTHRVTISGPLSFLFAQVIGKKTAQELPEAMNQLVMRAKELN